MNPKEYYKQMRQHMARYGWGEIRLVDGYWFFRGDQMGLDDEPVFNLEGEKTDLTVKRAYELCLLGIDDEARPVLLYG